MFQSDVSAVELPVFVKVMGRNWLSWLCLMCLTLPVFANQSLDEVTIGVYENHRKYVKASRTYGISWKIIEAAALQQGIKLVPVESSWRASLTRLKADKIDLVFTAIYTDERSQWANFSYPLPTSGSAIFTYKDNPVSEVSDIDLTEALIGVSAQSVQETFANEIGFANIYASVDRWQLYVMLDQRRLNYLFFSEGIVDYYCTYFHASGARDCLKRVGDHYDNNWSHVIGMKGNQRITKVIEKLDLGIHSFSQSDAAQALYQEYQYDRSELRRWREQLKLHSQPK